MGLWGNGGRASTWPLRERKVSALGTLIVTGRLVLILPSHFVMLCDISTRVCQRLDSQLNSDPLVVK
jgi:hypothetical protein